MGKQALWCLVPELDPLQCTKRRTFERQGSSEHEYPPAIGTHVRSSENFRHSL